MNRFTLIIACIAFLASFVANSSAQQPPSSIKGVDNFPANLSREIAESGTYVNGIYRNRLLRFSLAIPADWNLMSDDINKAAISTGTKIILEGQPASRHKAFEESASNTKILFTAQLPSLIEGATFVVGVEVNQPGHTQLKYAEFNRNLALGAFPTATLKKDLYEKTFGGVSFTCFDLELPTPKGTLKQTYSVVMLKSNVLFSVATYWSDEEKKSVIDALGTLTFETQ